MKLFDSIGPNPHVVGMFIAEKGIEIATETVDIMAGANRKPDYLAKNPSGGSPALELDDGSVLAEITAICEYLEERFPTPPLLGSTAEERAEARMWTRRIDLGICEPLTNGFRFSEGLPMFESRMRCLPEAADGLKAIVKDKLLWLDGLLGDKTFVCGDRFHPGRHHALLLFNFWRLCRPTASGRLHQNRRLARARRRSAQRQRLRFKAERTRGYSTAEHPRGHRSSAPHRGRALRLDICYPSRPPLPCMRS